MSAWEALTAALARPATYLYGPEEGLFVYLVDRTAQALGETAVRIRCDGPQAWEEAAQAALATGLWEEPRLVVARPEGRPGTVQAAQLRRALDRPAPGVRLLVREPPQGGGGLGGALQELRRHPAAMAAQHLSPRELVGFAQAAARQAGVRLSPAVAARLVDRVGGDLLRLLPELAKLATLAEGGAVTAEQVEAWVPLWPTARTFAVAEAYLNDNLPGALSALRQALAAGENPMGLLYGLVRQVRLLALAREVARVRPEVGVRELLHPLGLAHPFQAEPFAAAVRRGRPRPEGAWPLLLAADGDLKGETPPEIVLGRLLVALLAGAPTPPGPDAG